MYDFGLLSTSMETHLRPFTLIVIELCFQNKDVASGEKYGKGDANTAILLVALYCMTKQCY